MPAGSGVDDVSVVGISDSADLQATGKLNVDELIYILPPLDTPMLTGEGSDGLSLISQMPVDQKSFLSYTESFLAPNSTIPAGATNVATSFDVAAGDGAKFKEGDILRVHVPSSVGDETMYLTSISADTLTVQRGGTGDVAVGTPVTIPVNAVVVIIGSALIEGSAAPDARAHGRKEINQYVQIFGPTKLDMTETAQIVSKYGVPDEWARQLMFRIKENAQQREHTFLMGVPFYNDAGTDANSATGVISGSTSLNYELTTNVSASNDLDVAAIEAIQASCYDQGGIPDRMMANPKALGNINETIDTTRVRQDFSDDRRGRIPTMDVWTEFGPLMIARNRWCPVSHAFGFNRDGITRRVLRPLQYVRLAKTADSDQAHIVCEEGLQVKGEEHMFKFDDIILS